MISINPQGMLSTIDNNGEEHEVTGIYVYRLKYAMDVLSASENRQTLPDPENYISWSLEANFLNK